MKENTKNQPYKIDVEWWSIEKIKYKRCELLL